MATAPFLHILNSLIGGQYKLFLCNAYISLCNVCRSFLSMEQPVTLD